MVGVNRGEAAPTVAMPHRWHVRTTPRLNSLESGFGRWSEGVRDLFVAWCADCAGMAEVRCSKKQRPCSGHAAHSRAVERYQRKADAALISKRYQLYFDSDDRAGGKCSPTPQARLAWTGAISLRLCRGAAGPAKLQPNRWWERYRAAAGAVTMRST